MGKKEPLVNEETDGEAGNIEKDGKPVPAQDMDNKEQQRTPKEQITKYGPCGLVVVVIILALGLGLGLGLGGGDKDPCNGTCGINEKCEVSNDVATCVCLAKHTMDDDGNCIPDCPVPADDTGCWKPNGPKEECGTRLTFLNPVGGRIAVKHDYSWMALLGYAKDNGIAYLCAGSVINKWYILTAAHCIARNQHELVEIALGEHDINTNPDGDSAEVVRKKPKKITVHEKYDKENDKSAYDLALIRMDTPVELWDGDTKDSAVYPVCLPWETTDPGHALRLGKDLLTVTGWGHITDDITSEFRPATESLQQSKALYVDVAECAKEEHFEQNLNSTIQICAGPNDENEDACNGDAGGPLVIRKKTDQPWYQVGIVSYATSKCIAGKPSVYTRVTEFLTWLEMHMQP